MRRPTHAAGYSWRKWEDPLTHAPIVYPEWMWVLLFWLTCINAGALTAVLVFR